MKTILKSNLNSSAQIKLNGCPEKVSHTPILTPVSPLAQIQAQTVRPAHTRHISSASQVSVFILTSSVMVILNALKGKMKIYQSAMKNS